MSSSTTGSSLGPGFAPAESGGAARAAVPAWVPETRFGKWFLATNVWARYVVAPALDTLQGFARDAELPAPRRMLDVGCGRGTALPQLQARFAPESLLAIDIDPEMVAQAQMLAATIAGDVAVREGSVHALPLPDAAIDVVFCHQLVHHVTDHPRAIAEIFRVLAPGGALLLSESCASFIASWPVRWFFRHPDGVQKTADAYLEALAAAGFELNPRHIARQSPWWSQPDFGVAQRLGRRQPLREATELFVLARKPLAAEATGAAAPMRA